MTFTSLLSLCFLPFTHHYDIIAIDVMAEHRPTPKPLIVWVTTKCGKFLKRWEYQTILPASSESCMQVKKQ